MGRGQDSVPRRGKEQTMTLAGLEIDAIWIIMIACIIVVAVSLAGLCRACLIERHYYRTRGRVHHT
jgi:hypothetical protein